MKCTEFWPAYPTYPNIAKRIQTYNKIHMYPKVCIQNVQHVKNVWDYVYNRIQSIQHFWYAYLSKMLGCHTVDLLVDGVAGLWSCLGPASLPVRCYPVRRFGFSGSPVRFNLSVSVYCGSVSSGSVYCGSVSRFGASKQTKGGLLQKDS